MNRRPPPARHRRDQHMNLHQVLVRTPRRVSARGDARLPSVPNVTARGTARGPRGTAGLFSAASRSCQRLDQAARSLLVAALAVSAALLVGPSTSSSTTVRLAGTYALKGTQVPGVSVMTDAQVAALATQYVSSTYGIPPAPLVVVDYPGSLFPVSGLSTPTADQSEAAGLAALRRDSATDGTPVIFGYSQGAVIATEYKQGFNQQYANTAAPAAIPTPSFVLIGNPDRPNGGIFERFGGLYVPGLDLTFNGSTPTQTAHAAPGQITTYDVAGQYDGFADYPTYPINAVADLNAILGVLYVHTQYQILDASTAVLQGRSGDTAYYLIPTARLPLLDPLAQLGIPAPILAALDAPLRVLVEAGYSRSISPGQPTTAGVLPVANPLKVAADILAAIPTGLDDGLQQIGAGRPFATTPAGPYGVGGPAVTLPNPNLAVPDTATAPNHDPAPSNATPATSSNPVPAQANAPADASIATPHAMEHVPGRTTQISTPTTPTRSRGGQPGTPALRTADTDPSDTATTSITVAAGSEAAQKAGTPRPAKPTEPGRTPTPTTSRAPAPHRVHPQLDG